MSRLYTEFVFFNIFLIEDLYFGKLLAIVTTEYGLKTRVDLGSFGSYLSLRGSFFLFRLQRF